MEKIKMKFKKIIASFLVIAAILIYGLSAIRPADSDIFSIGIDLAKPVSIVWPCEITFVGDDGRKGLRIAPKIGRGWRGEAGGSADYKFYVPEDGRFTIWANCLWFDVCANAVFVQIDDIDKAILGNDPIYNKWHWVRGFDIDLEKGTHTLKLSNHSDHISLLEVRLTSSTATTPDGDATVFSNIFYEGFDGCDQGNFASWEIINGQWNVNAENPQICLEENILTGISDNNAMIIYPDDSWQDYYLNLSAKLIQSDLQSKIGICFGLTDAENYFLLRLDPEAGNGSIVRKSKSLENILTEFKFVWKDEKFNDIVLKCQADRIAVTINDSEPIELSIANPVVGGIGLKLIGHVKAGFDNIHIRKIN
jgi:hypothetical protein